MRAEIAAITPGVARDQLFAIADIRDMGYRHTIGLIGQAC
jgi:hypothetical protein